MPIITINLLEGRSPEQIQRMIADVSQAAAGSLDAPVETVRVIVNEMPTHAFGIGGRSAAAVIAERRAATGSATPTDTPDAQEEPA